MILDATQNFNEPLTTERLFSWHAALFPSGRKGMQKIIIGDWRDDSTGPMQVVSGPMGRERVHIEAPAHQRIPREMDRFLKWFNSETQEDPVLKAAKAHLWFVTIHPFEDGNGRIARAITDLMLSRAESQPQKFYSMSAQIRNERKAYYEILESTQKGDNDITQWMNWFLNCLLNAIDNSESTVRKVTEKHHFWNEHKNTPFNPRQIKTLNRLFSDFFGKLTTSKWAKINKCSQDTALRDIQDLVKKNVLKKQSGGGRSTSYEVIIPKD
jgi:Fic family protein